jgi:hypothetical protein
MKILYFSETAVHLERREQPQAHGGSPLATEVML